MSNDNQVERLWKLQAKVNMLVLDGKRDPKDVADTLQRILESPHPRTEKPGVIFRFSEPASSWREEDDIIYFSVTSDGTTGDGWIRRFEAKGFRLEELTKLMLRSPGFKPTNGVTTEVAVLKGMLFEDNDRITKKIRAEADKRRFVVPNVELACLIREKYTDEEIKDGMGLFFGIVAMHRPIDDSFGNPSLLSVDCLGRGIEVCSNEPINGWATSSGFAFEALKRRPPAQAST